MPSAQFNKLEKAEYTIVQSHFSELESASGGALNIKFTAQIECYFPSGGFTYQINVGIINNVSEVLIGRDIV